MPELDLSRRIVYSLEGMSGITSTRHVYLRAQGDELLMDIYMPPAASPRAVPAICFIHGGPIPRTMQPPREWGVFQSYGQLVAASGMAGIVFNHRLFAPTAYETAECDVKAAVEYIRQNADAIGLDRERIGLWAFSGSGPLLSWYWRERPAFVTCLLAFYAILDVRPLLPADADRLLIEKARHLSPAAHVTDAATLPPMLIARAGLDNPAFNIGIDGFVREAIAANAFLDVLNHPRGQHGFDILDDDARSRDIIARAIAFAAKYV